MKTSKGILRLSVLLTMYSVSIRSQADVDYDDSDASRATSSIRLFNSNCSAATTSPGLGGKWEMKVLDDHNNLLWDTQFGTNMFFYVQPFLSPASSWPMRFFPNQHPELGPSRLIKNLAFRATRQTLFDVVLDPGPIGWRVVSEDSTQEPLVLERSREERLNRSPANINVWQTDGIAIYTAKTMLLKVYLNSDVGETNVLGTYQSVGGNFSFDMPLTGNCTAFRFAFKPQDGSVSPSLIFTNVMNASPRKQQLDLVLDP